MSAVSGAFVAVDVFFVLSGYFITRRLVRELDDTFDRAGAMAQAARAAQTEAARGSQSRSIRAATDRHEPTATTELTKRRKR